MHLCMSSNSPHLACRDITFLSYPLLLPLIKLPPVFAVSLLEINQVSCRPKSIFACKACSPMLFLRRLTIV